ncbi:MAG: sigma-70 family RNA polymerase sigma factor [Deltaproteobacteria bacterium]|nr:sigma-70 family RNA polymerase sigma factor [Deltaproteobacteria bacterium]MCW5807971.1 sigma-70 family RNA polymerase sigma factor [Deltaproteobacteria bacterium]
MDDEVTARWIAEALERFEVPLLRFAARLLRDDERAKDIVQETFLSLCQQRRTDVEAHLAAWLFRVCRNRAIDLRRKETRVEMVASDAAPELAHEAGPDPSAIAQQREDAGQVMKILETLPESQQEAVYLRFQGGLSYQEIAEITGHSVTHVGVLLHTAVKKIRAHLAELSRPAARAAEGSR